MNSEGKVMKLKDYDKNTQCDVCGTVNGEVDRCWKCGAKLKR